MLSLIAKHAIGKFGYSTTDHLELIRHGTNVVFRAIAHGITTPRVDLAVRIGSPEGSQRMQNGLFIANSLVGLAPVAGYLHPDLIWVDGFPVTVADWIQKSNSPIDLANLGQSVRQFHDAGNQNSALKQRVPKVDPLSLLSQVQDDLRRKNNEQPNWLTEQHIAKYDHAVRLIREACFDVLHDPEFQGLIHVDLWPGNAIRTLDGRTVLTDFDNGGFGSIRADFAQIAYAVAAFGLPPEGWSAFCSGYGEDQAPSLEEMQSLVAAHELIWIGYDLFYATPENPSQFFAALQKLERFLESPGTPRIDFRGMPEHDIEWSNLTYPESRPPMGLTK